MLSPEVLEALGPPQRPLAVENRGLQLALTPFGDRALRHFRFLERPEGMPVEDADVFVKKLAEALPIMPASGRELDEEAIVAHAQDFATVGHLYRAIDVGFAWLC